MGGGGSAAHPASPAASPADVTHPLVTVEQLAAQLAGGDVALADVRWYLTEPERGRAEYQRGHLPGAVFVDLDGHLTTHPGPGRHPLPSRETFAATMGALGFGDDRFVVAYDDVGGAVAARLWWMLRDIGHEHTAVLDGGIQAWRDAGRDLVTTTPTITRRSMTVRSPLTRSIDRVELAERLGTVTLIDARAAERYRGELEPIDPVAGHIPTARNVPQSENLATEMRLLPPRMLSARYQAAGVRPGVDTVVYCGSGVNACLDILAMKVAGLPEPLLYPGSWSDWSTAGMTAETG